MKGGKNYFEKLESQTKLAEIEENSIIEYDYTVVDYDETLKQYVCNEQYGDDGLVSIPTWLIHHDDVNKFNLNKGDVVSVARMKDINIVRIRWKYNTDEIIPTPKPKKLTVKNIHSHVMKQEFELQEIPGIEAYLKSQVRIIVYKVSVIYYIKKYFLEIGSFL